MRLVITRPLEDSQSLAITLTEMGHHVVMSPVLRIVLHSGADIPDRAYQAIAITSANGSRALTGHPAMARLRKLPVFTVGEQSANAASQAGFTRVEATGGDVNALVGRLLAVCDLRCGPILYVSGQDIAGSLEGVLGEWGFEMERVVLYEAVAARALEKAAAQALTNREVDGVLLYSRRSAGIWRNLIENAGLAAVTRPVPHYCLSLKVAAALWPGYVTDFPERPDEASLLALLDPPR